MTQANGDSHDLPTSEQNTKYDRQLRLWGAHGQKALMESRILLINAGPTGTETLKNLVLPGLGYFCILDDKKVTTRDLKNNFFVTKAHLGQSRAQVTMELLAEMNPDVQGGYKAVNPSTLIKNNPDFFRGFTLIVATQMDEEPLRELASLAWTHRIPMVIARSYGLIGYVRLVMPEMTIVESKSPGILHLQYNLSVMETLPELQAYSDSIDLESLGSHDLNKIPFVILLIKAREKWLAANGGQLPNFKTKKAFQDVISSLWPINDKGEENFMEAVKNAHLAYTKVSLPQCVEEVFSDPMIERVVVDPSLENMSPVNFKFWVIARAIKQFTENEGKGQLPNGGSIPDMASSTLHYTNLQKIYQAKATEDRKSVFRRVREILESTSKFKDSITEDDVAYFCKFAYGLTVIHTRSIEDEYTDLASENIKEIFHEPTDQAPEMNPLLFYLGLRAVDRFRIKYGRLPGLVGSSLENDTDSLWLELQGLWKELAVEEQVEVTVKKEHAAELVRYGASELHNVAAIVGGVASQEIVKIITRQFVPLNNTFIFNGIASAGGSYSL